MILKPCRWCKSKDFCLDEKKHRDKLRSILGDGLKITIAHIACKKYFEQFTPGDRVEFSRIVWDGEDFPFVEDTEDDHFIDRGIGWKIERYKATFIRWNCDKKAVIQLDEPIKVSRKDGQGGWVDVEFRFIPIYPHNHPKGQTIKKINEDPWVVCSRCEEAVKREIENKICFKCEEYERMALCREAERIARATWKGN